MLLSQQFKTADGAQKRARFENAHCGGRYHYAVTRCLNGEPDNQPLNLDRWQSYTWRLSKTLRANEVKD